MSHLRTRPTIGSVALSVAFMGLSAGATHADVIRVTITNENPNGGFYFTPFWIAGHNGTFDMYDRGSYSQPNWPGMTEIAENGNTGPLGGIFAASGAGMAGGRSMTVTADMLPPGVFSPGESATVDFDMGDSMVNRYLSYASMVIPSNDLFIGNDDAMAHEVFDAMGHFNGPFDILIYGRMVNDNGTEVNNAFGDAAFSLNDGQAMPEYNQIRALFSDPGDQDYLDSFIGTQVATMETITSSFGAESLIATIHVGEVPAPGSLAFLAMGGLAAAGGRRRRRA